ncbi:hypothetical protein C8R45DRAFT_930571 [Mycena sanguinolenta]|nr:hypothetical protein C8R45DRAFT_930571 [Mycena sanguinolenta]
MYCAAPLAPRTSGTSHFRTSHFWHRRTTSRTILGNMGLYALYAQSSGRKPGKCVLGFCAYFCISKQHGQLSELLRYADTTQFQRPWMRCLPLWWLLVGALLFTQMWNLSAPHNATLIANSSWRSRKPRHAATAEYPKIEPATRIGLRQLHQLRIDGSSSPFLLVQGHLWIHRDQKTDLISHWTVNTSDDIAQIQLKLSTNRLSITLKYFTT